MSDVVDDQPIAAEEPWTIPARLFVPSEREVEGGLADYTFEPLPPPPPKPPFSLGTWARQRAQDLDPRGLFVGAAAFPLVMLCLDALFTQWDDVAFNLLLPEIRDDLRVDVLFLIGLGTATGLLTSLLLPVLGYIADRRSRVKMLALGNLCQNGATLLAGAAPGVPLLAASRGAVAIGNGLSRPSQPSLITDWFPLSRRARTITFVFTIGALGHLVAPFMATVLSSTIGWRGTLLSLGALATFLSLGYFFLKEPKRGKLDRLSLGADDETASREQAPMSWSEGWRTASQIATLRRIWYATPFLMAGVAMHNSAIGFYYADDFGLSVSQRAAIQFLGTTVSLVGLQFAGSVIDRVLAYRPGRVFGLIGLVLVASAGSNLVLAGSRWVWLSVGIGLPVGFMAVIIQPAQLTLMSIVVPARVRAQCLAAAAPWQVLGQAFTLMLLYGLPFIDLSEGGSVRVLFLVAVPLNLAAAALIGGAGKGVAADMRAATAASMADEEARRARASGRNKMIVCRDVEVTYEATPVVLGVDFDVEEGEIVALLGTNGAGKSTLLRAIAGIQEASNGAIFLDGQDITHRPPHQNAAGGIVFMPGGRAVFPTLTVAENLRAAGWLYREDEGYVREQTEHVLGMFPLLRERLDQQAGSMSGGEQQMLALAQAFLMKPRLLMIDELSLGLAPAIVEQLLETLRQMHAEGTTIVLVEQSVNVALTVAQRAVFMDRGEIRFDGPTAELLARGDLLRSVFLGGGGGGGGRVPSIGLATGLLRTRVEVADEDALTADDIVVRYGGHRVLDGAHVSVRRGDIVGIIGPNGAGKTTLFDVLSGFTSPEQGRIVLAGHDVTDASPEERARLGLTRSFQSARLFPSLTVRENIAVGLDQRIQTRTMLAPALWLPKARQAERRAHRRVEYLVDLLNLEPFANKFVDELSTGTRRMVDLACVMATEPLVLLLDEPCSGLAQSEVEVLGPMVKRISKETGCGVLLIEHDIPFTAALCDRVVAMELGTVIAEGLPDDVVEHPRVVQAYLGASESTIHRSGQLTDALSAAGIRVDGEPRRNGARR